MNRRQQSINGLVPRRAGSRIGEQHYEELPQPVPSRREIRSAGDMANETIGRYRPERSIGRAEIDESLANIGGASEEQTGGRRRLRRLRKSNIVPKKVVKHKKTKIIAISLAVIVAGVLGFIGFKALEASNNIFTGGIFGLFEDKPLATDANGRSNFLILGSTDDDPTHPGNNLTDTIMVVSVDQKTKNAYMFSVPRDLYVQYGMMCPSGSAGKLNVYFSCSDTGTTKQAEQDRLAKTEKFIGNILGMTFQYGVHVNSTVVRDAVNAVGGIDVDIQGDGPVPAGVTPGSVMDRNFDWICNYTCYKVKYSAGVHHLNGSQAMFFSMARGDGGYAASTYGTYGFIRSDFDREIDQQKVLQALRVKATSTGFLANPSAVTKLIDAVGDNLRTNIPSSEFRTLMGLASSIPSSSIKSINFENENPAIFTTGEIGAADVVYPTAGMQDYSALQEQIRRTLSSNPVVHEAASIVVLNGTTEDGLASSQATMLTDEGLNITNVANADNSQYQNTVIYQTHSGYSATAADLSKLYGVKIQTTAPPVTVDSGTDFVIILGVNHSTSSSTP